MNKKGDIFQLVFILIILLIAAIVGLLFLTLSGKVITIYQSMPIMNQTTVVEVNNVMQQTAPTTTDYMIFFIFLGSVMGVVISAVKTNFSPTIIFMFLMLLVITIFVASGVVNIYSGFAQDVTLAEYANQLTLTNFIISKYTPLIMAVLGGLILLIMYGKSGSDIIP